MSALHLPSLSNLITHWSGIKWVWPELWKSTLSIKGNIPFWTFEWNVLICFPLRVHTEHCQITELQPRASRIWVALSFKVYTMPFRQADAKPQDIISISSVFSRYWTEDVSQKVISPSFVWGDSSSVHSSDSHSWPKTPCCTRHGLPQTDDAPAFALPGPWIGKRKCGGERCPALSSTNLWTLLSTNLLRQGLWEAPSQSGETGCALSFIDNRGGQKGAGAKTGSRKVVTALKVSRAQVYCSCSSLWKSAMEIFASFPFLVVRCLHSGGIALKCSPQSCDANRLRPALSWRPHLPNALALQKKKLFTALQRLPKIQHVPKWNTKNKHRL